ncbi:unnamed protein product [Symbiodinium sp. CCMP2456]|nr:unnamed protein product [Symbiodinium sp. CCMP2456]
MLPDPGGPGAPHARSQAQAAQAAQLPSHQGGVTPPMQTPGQPAPIRHQDPSLLPDSLIDSSSGHMPPSPTASVASAAGVATTPVATPVTTPATAAPNPPRGVSAPSATPSECSTVVRHGQFNTAACDEATDDSDPDVSSWHGRGQQQSLQDVLAFLDQKEREVSMIFSKTRTQLLQAMPMPPSTDGSGSAVRARSDEATVRWREFGEPFYRAISLRLGQGKYSTMSQSGDFGLMWHMVRSGVLCKRIDFLRPCARITSTYLNGGDRTVTRPAAAMASAAAPSGECSLQKAAQFASDLGISFNPHAAWQRNGQLQTRTELKHLAFDKSGLRLGDKLVAKWQQLAMASVRLRSDGQSLDVVFASADHSIFDFAQVSVPMDASATALLQAIHAAQLPVRSISRTVLTWPIRALHPHLTFKEVYWLHSSMSNALEVLFGLTFFLTLHSRLSSSANGVLSSLMKLWEDIQNIYAGENLSDWPWLASWYMVLEGFRGYGGGFLIPFTMPLHLCLLLLDFHADILILTMFLPHVFLLWHSVTSLIVAVQKAVAIFLNLTQGRAKGSKND